MKRKSMVDIIIDILILIIIICVAVLFYKYYFEESEIINLSDSSKYIFSIFDENGDNSNTITNNTSSKIALNNYKYYYSQLDDNAKKIYESIEENVENLKTGTYIINIPSEVGKILENDNGNEILNEEFQSAWDAIIMDNVELFYIDVSKITLEIKTTSYGRKKTYDLLMKPNQDTYLEDEFDSEEKVNSAILKLRNTKSQIISMLPENDYEKIVQINEILVQNLEYGNENNNAYSIYGALLQRNCVCEGYAEAFKYIMDGLNIPCILVIGDAKNSEGNRESHEWNYVKLNDNWYAVDVTWNDPVVIGGGTASSSLKSKYLLKGADIYSNHTPNGKVSENGIAFTYPELSLDDYKN